ncbi:hypothetical protein [Streptomyces hoynatensis]|uniref:hypothetical protein n=1 Tax=Streptomyces hoynatensis TaxID=1141874 RepID=UPI0011C3E96E|nr:hypothetical protein [Streptomyces hoynatensis]
MGSPPVAPPGAVPPGAAVPPQPPGFAAGTWRGGLTPGRVLLFSFVLAALLAAAGAVWLAAGG